MILRTKESTCFILLLNIFYITEYSNGEESSDSDDDSLRQALLLVDILKSEYTNVLRENVNRESENNDDLSTCAPTERINDTLSSSDDHHDVPTTLSTENPPLSVSLLLPQSTAHQKPLESGLNPSYIPMRQNWQDRPLQTLTSLRSPAFASLQALQRFQTPTEPQLYGSHRPPNYPAYYMENIQRPYRDFRRMVPRDYYYFDNKMDIDNKMNGYDNAWLRRSPFFNRRILDGAVNRTTSSPSVTSGIESTLTSVSLPPPTSSPVINKNTALQDATRQSIKPWIKPLIVITTKKKRRSNPILDQVAAELINEIRVTKMSTEDTSNKKKHILAKKRYYTNKKHRRSFEQPIPYAKTTLRVHMEGSTRLPIPLPDNNAYCFYNPKSFLCRALI